jgi:predicted nucleotide-binding protein
MATRRGATPPHVEVKTFTIDEIDRGIAKLRRRIDEMNGLEQARIAYDDQRVRTAETNIRESIRDVFGAASPEFRDHEFHDIWHGGYNAYDDEQIRQQKFLQGVVDTRTMVEGLIGRLEEKRADLAAYDSTQSNSVTATKASHVSTTLVFLVHGHDEAAKQTTARFLEQLHLTAIVLSERPSEGRTVIEKFERNSDVGFAVVLMTPDDVGYQRGMDDQPRPRARQNVVLELGYFVGRLTRARVAVLYKGSVELPSDYHGVLYIPMDEANGWKLHLARELKNAGMEVDMNDAL